MTQDRIINEYFEWLFNLVCSKRYSKRISFRKLLQHLHSITFSYSIPKDVNRANDGIDLRYRFALSMGYSDVPRCLDGPCSVLEMMVAWAVRCEENIMDDPSIGDRTAQWFWGMITNLGLGSMLDDKYDRQYVDRVIERFLNREYEPDGKGGLFRVRRCTRDLRNVEIWYQLCWYLDSIT